MLETVSTTAMPSEQETNAAFRRFQTSVKTIATFILLLLVLPLNLALTAIALLRSIILKPFQSRTIADS
ncbi:ATP-grasp enzyme, partial [Microcoleus sp. LEGE 07076]|nr:ATP-grasp enzyme [Microcoleus sp. LEGE 07076]